MAPIRACSISELDWALLPLGFLDYADDTPRLAHSPDFFYSITVGARFAPLHFDTPLIREIPFYDLPPPSAEFSDA